MTTNPMSLDMSSERASDTIDDHETKGSFQLGPKDSDSNELSNLHKKIFEYNSLCGEVKTGYDKIDDINQMLVTAIVDVSKKAEELGVRYKDIVETVTALRERRGTHHSTDTNKYSEENESAANGKSAGKGTSIVKEKSAGNDMSVSMEMIGKNDTFVNSDVPLKSDKCAVKHEFAEKEKSVDTFKHVKNGTSIQNDKSAEKNKLAGKDISSGKKKSKKNKSTSKKKKGMTVKQEEQVLAKNKPTEKVASIGNDEPVKKDKPFEETDKTAGHDKFVFPMRSSCPSSNPRGASGATKDDDLTLAESKKSRHLANKIPVAQGAVVTSSSSTSLKAAVLSSPMDQMSTENAKKQSGDKRNQKDSIPQQPVKVNNQLRAPSVQQTKDKKPTAKSAPKISNNSTISITQANPTKFGEQSDLVQPGSSVDIDELTAYVASKRDVFEKLTPIDTVVSKLSQPLDTSGTKNNGTLSNKKLRKIRYRERKRLERDVKRMTQKKDDEAGRDEEENRAETVPEKRQGYNALVKLFFRNGDIGDEKKNITRAFSDDFKEAEARQFLMDRIRAHKGRQDENLIMWSEVLLENMCPLLAEMLYDVYQKRDDLVKSLVAEKSLIADIFSHSYVIVACRSLRSGNFEDAETCAERLIQNYISVQQEIRSQREDLPDGLGNFVSDLLHSQYKLDPEPPMNWEKANKFFAAMYVFYARHDQFNGFMTMLSLELVKADDPILNFDGVTLPKLLSPQLQLEQVFRSYAMSITRFNAYDHL